MPDDVDLQVIPLLFKEFFRKNQGILTVSNFAQHTKSYDIHRAWDGKKG